MINLTKRNVKERHGYSLQIFEKLSSGKVVRFVQYYPRGQIKVND